MFINYFSKFLQLFSQNYKSKLIILIILSVFCGLFEFLGVAMVFPLIIFILNPTQSTDIIFLPNKLPDNSNLLLILGALIVLAFLFKNLLMIYKTYYQFGFLKNWQNELNLSVFKKYLYSSFETNLKASQENSVFQIWNLSNIIFNNFITMVLNLFSNLIIIAIIFVFLLWKFNIWAIITCAFFLVCGLLQSKFFKSIGRKLTKEKVKILAATNNSFLSAIKSFKDIKIFAKENHFYNVYKKQIQNVGKIDSLINFYNTIPQNIVEISIIFSIIIMCYGIVKTSLGNSQEIIASFSLLAAAMFRMAPIINKLQSNLNIINMSKPAVVEFFNAYEFYDNLKQNHSTQEKLTLKEKITIKNLSYSYDDKKILNNLNLEIQKGEFIGIIGKSGVGKSTFLDVLMGILISYDGELYTDNEQLNELSSQKWINSIGYVPQEITILPASIAANIAFCLDEEEINHERISKIIELVQLTDYIKTLPNGTKEILNNLSGLSVGQKQRIGLARALYKQPQILFLDEVTSALDLETENKIIQCLNALKGEKTIIAIAHRLSTLKNCDRIFYFKNANTVLCGSFETLIDEDEEFKNLINLASVDNIINTKDN